MFSGVWSQTLDIGFLIVIFPAVIFFEGIRGALPKREKDEEKQW